MYMYMYINTCTCTSISSITCTCIDLHTNYYNNYYYNTLLFSYGNSLSVSSTNIIIYLL